MNKKTKILEAVSIISLQLKIEKQERDGWETSGELIIDTTNATNLICGVEIKSEKKKYLMVVKKELV